MVSLVKAITFSNPTTVVEFPLFFNFLFILLESHYNEVNSLESDSSLQGRDGGRGGF